MKVAAVTPITGQFGSMVYEIQPRVRAWLRETNAEHRVVFASRELAFLFEEATDVIEIPTKLVATVPASLWSIDKKRRRSSDADHLKIKRLVEWAKGTIQADAWLEIPYFRENEWNAPATFVQLRSGMPAPQEPYVIVAACANKFASWQSWPAQHWDQLVRRIKKEWNLNVYAIGKSDSPLVTEGVIAQEVDELQRLEHSVSLLNGATCCISSYGDLTHLSLMAGCPTFTWGDPGLKTFVENYTNPLKTPSHYCPTGWDPDVESVWIGLCRWRNLLESQKYWKPNACHKTLISMCMIARDSSHTLGAALGSIKPWVDEMIVVDTGSTDDTAIIAETCGARVFHAPWQDSFSAARNESLRHAQGEWILWMDSDDTIDQDNGRKLKSLVAQNHSPSVMGYVLKVDCPTTSSNNAYKTKTVVDHVKLIRNIPAIQFAGRIHEQVLSSIRQLGGEVGWTDIHVTHSGSDLSPEGKSRKHGRDLRLLELALADDPDNTFTLFNMGMTLLDASRPTEALNYFCRSLQMASGEESHLRKLYALLVQAYVALGRTESAMRSCLQGLTACPQDPELLFRKGLLEQTAGLLNEAERTFQMLVHSSNQRYFSSCDDGILGIKAWHNLAVLYEQRDQPDMAEKAWEQVLEFNPANAIAWWGLLDAATSSKCAQKLELLTTRQGVPPQIRCIAQARLLADQGRVVEGLALMEAEFQESFSVEVLDQLCQMAFNHNLTDNAERWLAELSRCRPDDPSVAMNLGSIYFRRHQYAKAAEFAKRSLALRSDYPSANRLLSQALMMLRLTDGTAR